MASTGSSSSYCSFSSSKRQRGADGSAVPCGGGRGGAIPAEFDAPLRPPVVAALGTVSTRAGFTRVDRSAFNFPYICGLARDPLSDDLFVSTKAGLFRVAPTGVVTLLAGSWDNNETGDIDAVGHAARFKNLRRLVASPDGTMLFFSDMGSHKVKCLVLATGEVRTVAGSGRAGSANGVGAVAHFYRPAGITISPDGRTLFVADRKNHMVRCIDAVTGEVRTVAGSGEAGSADGVGAAAQFYYPSGITISPDGRMLFVADYANNKVRQVDVVTGEVRTFAGNGRAGSADGVGAAAQFNGPSGITISPDGRTLYVTDCGNHRMLFVADYANNKVRQVDAVTGEVRTVAGSGRLGNADGVGAAAQFDNPYAIMLSSDGATLTVSSTTNGGRRLRTIAVAPPPAAAPELVIPPSTLAADFTRTVGDATLPDGKVTFVVGPAKRRIEHVAKNLLCVRSEYFSRMFRSSLAEGTGADDAKASGEGKGKSKAKKKAGQQEIKIPDTTPEAFRTLITYLVSDAVDVDPSTHMQKAYDVIKLADKYDVERLGLLVTKAMTDAVRGDTAVPFLEAAQTMGDARLFGQCRSWIVEKPGDVRRSGGVEQLTDLGVAKGLLGDAMDEVVRMKRKYGE